MREKKLCRSYIGPRRVDGSLLLDIGFCKNPRILWWNVSFWFNDFIGLQNLRDTWKYRKNNQNYKKCLTTFNNALKNKLQYWNTEDIPYLKAIKQKCARCKWPKRKNYSQANCVRNCEGRFKISFRHVSGLIQGIFRIKYSIYRKIPCKGLISNLISQEKRILTVMYDDENEFGVYKFQSKNNCC